MIRNEIMSKVYGKVLKNLLVISGVLLAIYLLAQLILKGEAIIKDYPEEYSGLDAEEYRYYVRQNSKQL